MANSADYEYVNGIFGGGDGEGGGRGSTPPHKWTLIKIQLRLMDDSNAMRNGLLTMWQGNLFRHCCNGSRFRGRQLHIKIGWPNLSEQIVPVDITSGLVDKFWEKVQTRLCHDRKCKVVFLRLTIAFKSLIILGLIQLTFLLCYC